jgi:pimeloyl-ACP methyl ester carboxylesterase
LPEAETKHQSSRDLTAIKARSMSDIDPNLAGDDGTSSDRRSFLRVSAGLSLAASAFGAAFAQGAPLPAATEAVTPFRASIPQADLDDLRRRLGRVRWPDRETVSDWSQGVPLAKAQTLISYWRDHYNWRRFETRLSAYPQFRTQIDGLGVHFIHVKSKNADALPLILTHGWPGSFIEFLKIIGPLTDPTAHGGQTEDAFHVVIPSLPGFGFSDKPTQSGWRLPRIAAAWDVLMKRLGYGAYVAQGGDWGSGVTTYMGKLSPSGLRAIHLNLPILFPPPPPQGAGYGPEEQAAVAQLLKYSTDGAGYAAIQGTRPQTLGYGLADSPAGQAAWIYEKLAEWTDSGKAPETVLTLDEMLDNISLYWLTDTAASSARLYWESFSKDFARTELALPVAVSVFKGDSFTPPKVWGERTYSKLIYWGEVPRGGHFAAWEQPDLFVGELRAAFRSLRPA